MNDSKTERLKEFLKNQSCLIVEPSPSFSASIQASVASLGLLPASILIARKFEQALQILQEKKPLIVIAEAQIENQHGLTVIEQHEKQLLSMPKISILVTRHSSDLTLAQAAGDKVDAVLVKPFSPEALMQQLTIALNAKLQPSPYMAKIFEGKRYLSVRDFDNALAAFQSAQKLTTAPTLAYFYTGQTLESRGKFDQALDQYRAGRQHQDLDYNCLTAQFDLLFRLKRYAEAVSLIEPIRARFPLPPSRLAPMFVVAAFARRFDEVDRLYGLMLRFETRSEDLAKIASMALLAAGSQFLKAMDFERAKDMFEKGLRLVDRNLDYLAKVVSELIQAGATHIAQEFLAKVTPGDTGTPEYVRLAFRVDQLSLPSDRILERARKIVMDGHADPEIFRTAVRVTAELGKYTMAESMITKAVQSFPEMRAQLYQILDASSEKNKH